MVEKKTLKKAVKKTTVKTAVVKKVAVKKVAKTEIKVAPQKKMEATLSVALFDVKGIEKGTVKLPEAVFGAKINKPLMAQAVRVYLANQRMGSAVSKTRGEVDGSTRKIYRQKGTGKARHGGIRAPLFVGGGTAHGPKLKDYSLTLSTKMKKAAVLSALSTMAQMGHIYVVSGFAALEPKTKVASVAFSGMGLVGKKALLVMPEHNENVFRATRNMDRLNVVSANILNTYDILNAGMLVIMQEALSALEKQMVVQKKERSK